MSKRAKLPKVKNGDFVLIGGTQASYPSGWYLGGVLWIGGEDVLVDRYTVNGGTWRQLISIWDIRAVGSIDFLNGVHQIAREAVFELQKRINDAEIALDASRNALWDKVDELAKSGIKVISPDFAASEAHSKAIQHVIDCSDADPLEPDLCSACVEQPE